MAFELPALPYAPDALEPHIDRTTMEIHHGKHHATYVANLNKALESASDWQGRPIEEIIAKLEKLPDSIRTAVRNNGGGHINHSLFWTTMGPGKGGQPRGELGEGIASTFGGFDKFKEIFTNAALTRFGSGWAWLVLHDRKLEVMSTPNQDSPILEGKTPLLGLDVWEHAYYLKYQNRRADYAAAFWNVVDWEAVGRALNR
jgi:Fe-Mn family superoxide dismutase